MQPNSDEFPDFDDNLRQAFQRETELFFESVMREDRNVLDLMTADYTFLNERLARHYGIPNVYGSQFRRVTLADDARRGCLGKGAILMVTSHTDRTSPVVRGKWILDNLLGAPPPPPPAIVPPLNESAQREAADSDACASAWKSTGRIRCAPVATRSWIQSACRSRISTRSARGATATAIRVTQGTPIDADGQLLDGTKVDGVVTLRQALVRRPEIFVGTVTEKLMIYALGRGPGLLRHAGRARDRRATRRSRISFLVDRAGHRQQRAVSEADDAGGRRAWQRRAVCVA